MITRRISFMLAALTGAAMLLPMAPQGAQAQLGDYPNRPVELVIPYPPGGSEALGRKIAATMSKNIGKEIVIVNVPGASTQVASRQVKEAKPDGYKIYVSSPPEFVAGPVFFGRLPFDPLKDFTPITFHAEAPYFILISAQLPVKNYQEFAAYLKANPDKVRFGSYGALSQSDILARRYRKAVGINFDIIPYQGGGPAFNAMLAGEIQAVVATPIPTRGFIKDGKMRPVAVTTSKRLAMFPDAPTLMEVGINIEDSASYGLVGPAGLPKPIVDFWVAEWTKAMNDPETKKFIEDMGVQIVASSPGFFKDWLEKNSKTWASFPAELGIEVKK
jgi:tripartite-type tricarboxylate transporter receptor subunit TctC